MSSGAHPVAPAVRQLDPSDAPLLAALGRRLWVESYEGVMRPEDIAAFVDEQFAPQRVEARLRDPRERTILADVGGEPAGYATLRDGPPDGHEVGARPVELLRFYVDRRWHGRGVAHALFEACREDAAATGDAMWLSVWQRNPRAIAFYRKCGFEVAGTLLFRVGEDVQTDHLMARPLP